METKSSEVWAVWDTAGILSARATAGPAFWMDAMTSFVSDAIISIPEALGQSVSFASLVLPKSDLWAGKASAEN